MIIVTAKLFQNRGCSPTELLHATIINRGPATDWADRPGDRYFAHVLARPSDTIPVVGFEADIMVDGHMRSHGITPLLSGIFGACYHVSPEKKATYRGVAGVSLRDMTAYERTKEIAARSGFYVDKE